MAKISQVLAAQQGIYRWRVRDCLITAQAVIQSQGLIPPDYSQWHQMDEPEAIRAAQKEYGSLHKFDLDKSLCMVILFSKSGLKPIKKYSIGDILLLEGKIFNKRLNTTINVGQITRLGFIVNNYEVWTWFDFGLYPIHGYSVVGGFS